MNMFLKIWNYRSKLIKSIFFDLFLFISLSKIYKIIHNYRLDFLILIFFTWIILSYIFGRYHDFKQLKKEIIIKNVTYPIIITFNPSYLIRFPENKKYSWDDLKKIRQKIKDLNIEI